MDRQGKKPELIVKASQGPSPPTTANFLPKTGSKWKIFSILLKTTPSVIDKDEGSTSVTHLRLHLLAILITFLHAKREEASGPYPPMLQNSPRTSLSNFHPESRAMKISLAALLALSVFAFPPLHAQNPAQNQYNQGVLLFNQGKFDEALAIFEQVLQAKPDFVYARSYAQRCKNAIAQNLGPKNDLEGRLARIVIPEIAFADAPIGDVLDYLAARAQEISKGETVVNFIYKGTPEQRTGTLVTLSLRNIPLNEAIKYVGQLSRSAIKYEPHAVVVDPGSATAAEPDSTPATPALQAP